MTTLRPLCQVSMALWKFLKTLVWGFRVLFQIWGLAFKAVNFERTYELIYTVVLCPGNSYNHTYIYIISVSSSCSRHSEELSYEMGSAANC